MKQVPCPLCEAPSLCAGSVLSLCARSIPRLISSDRHFRSCSPAQYKALCPAGGKSEPSRTVGRWYAQLAFQNLEKLRSRIRISLPQMRRGVCQDEEKILSARRRPSASFTRGAPRKEKSSVPPGGGTLARNPGGHLRAALQAHLRQKRRDVVLHGLLRDTEFLANLTIR